jgi:hypothetical protein
MKNNTKYLTVAETWAIVDEPTRKQVFSGIYSCDKKSFRAFSRHINGFQIKSLPKRPASIAAALDKHLFTIDSGKFAEFFFTKFFTLCEETIDQRFVELFNDIAVENTDYSSSKVSNQALKQLKENPENPSLLSLYEAALREYFPHRFSSEIPVIEEKPEEPKKDIPPKDKIQKKEKTQPRKNPPKTTRNKTNTPPPEIIPKKKTNSNPVEAFSVSQKTNDSHPQSGITIEEPNENSASIIKQTISSLLELPTNEVLAEDHIEIFRVIKNILNFREEFLSTKDAFNKQISKLKSTGILKSGDIVDKTMDLVLVKNLDEAINHLRSQVEKISTIEECLFRYQTLNTELCNNSDLPHSFTASDNLDSLQSDLELLIDNVENDLKDQRLSQKVLLDFIENVEGCNFETALNFIEQIDNLEWEKFIHACIVCSTQGQIVPTLSTPIHQATSTAIGFVKHESFLGLIISFVWISSKDSAIRMLDELHTGLAKSNPKSIWSSLSGLTWDQLLDVAEELPQYVNIIGELSIFSIIQGRDSEFPDWLNILSRSAEMTPNLTKFIEEIVRANERGSLLGEFQNLISIDSVSSSSDQAISRALNKIQNHASHSGWGGNYRKLRDLSQKRFIAPVMKDVSGNCPKGAHERWASFGTCDMMVQECAKSFPDARQLNKSHRDQVEEYLNTFDDLLRSWVSACKKIKKTDRAFAKAYHALRESDFPASTSIGYTFIDLIKCHLANEEEPLKTVPVFFGQISDIPGTVKIDYIQTIEPESWIRVCNNERGNTQSVVVLVERLLNLINGIEPKSSPDTLFKELLDRQKMNAANQLSHVYPELAPSLQPLFNKFKNEFETNHATVLEKAKVIAHKNSSIKYWLSEIENKISEFQKNEAEELILFLEEELNQVEAECSEEFISAQTFLHDAGIEIKPSWCLKDLGQQIKKVKEINLSRRRHILLFQQVIEFKEFDLDFIETISHLSVNIDNPTYWPASSNDLVQVLKDLINYLKAKSRIRASHPDLFSQLSHAIGAFIVHHLNAPLVNKQNLQASIDQLFALGVAIQDNFLDPNEVIVKISESIDLPEATEKTTSHLFSNIDVSTEPSPAPLVTTPPKIRRVARQADVIVKINQTIRDLASNNPQTSLPDRPHHKLRILKKEKKWDEAFALAVAIAIEDDLEEKWPTPMTSACCHVGLEAMVADEIPIDLEQLTDLILGVMAFLIDCDPAEPSYFIDSAEASESIINAIVCGWSSFKFDFELKPERKMNISSFLNELNQAPSTEGRFKWTETLFSKASALVKSHKPSGSSNLSSFLWEQLTGLDNSARSRFFLLKMGFRMQQESGFLKHLSDVHAPEFSPLLVKFFSAVRSADSNTSAWDDARRLAQSFREQVEPTTHKPWRLLVDDLNQLRKSTNVSGLCEISLENCTPLGNRRYLLELCLTPDKYTILKTVSIELKVADSAEAIFPSPRILNSEENEISKETIYRINVDLSKLGIQEDSTRLAFKITAVSATGQSESIVGNWSIELRKIRTKPLSPAVLSRCWKGAEGRPVASNMQSFHGRKNELATIQDQLNGQEGYQGSALVIGQRRIGKTSLLVETLGQYEPSRGRVCAIFCQFGGIQKRTQDEPLAKTIFEAFTECSDVTGYNKEFKNLMTKELGLSWNRQLRKKLNPANSIAHALNSYVENIERASNGLIKRVAFVADEFQDVFQFDSKEIDKVMWGLRPLVQMSPKISLILAGSGLTRDLIGSYNQALFGSIKTIHLKPFDLEDEAEAIADTLIPMEVRNQLCPNEEKLQSIISHAHFLTGGHPWFLSMLGRSAAIKLEGRPISKSLLNEVASSMISGKVSPDGSTGDANRFYGHLFDSLDIKGDGKYHAILILTNFAKQVTSEWEWLSAEQAISGTLIEKSKMSTQDCIKALTLLKNEDILELESKQGVRKYRIRVPLVAEAIRYDAEEIEFDAKFKLGLF